MTRLVVAERILGDEIEAQGGLMKVGLYSTGLDVGDIPGESGVGELLADASEILRKRWVETI